MRIPLLAAAIMLPMATAVLACGEKKACSYEENFSTDVLGDGSWTLVLDGEVPEGAAAFWRQEEGMDGGGCVFISSPERAQVSVCHDVEGLKMIYKDVKGDRFDWLYVDFPLLKSIAETCGLHGELVAEGEHYDYLARIF